MYKGINYGLLMRYKKKLNSELQDLYKAMEYLTRRIAYIKGE